MDRKTRRGIAHDVARLLREEHSAGSLLALIGLDLVAFAGAAALALGVPDALDAAASSANESAFVFAVPAPGLPPPDVLDSKPLAERAEAGA